MAVSGQFHVSIPLLSDGGGGGGRIPSVFIAELSVPASEPVRKNSDGGKKEYLPLTGLDPWSFTLYSEYERMFSLKAV